MFYRILFGKFLPLSLKLFFSSLRRWAALLRQSSCFGQCVSFSPAFGTELVPVEPLILSVHRPSEVVIQLALTHAEQSPSTVHLKPS